MKSFQNNESFKYAIKSHLCLKFFKRVSVSFVVDPVVGSPSLVSFVVVVVVFVGVPISSVLSPPFGKVIHVKCQMSGKVSFHLTLFLVCHLSRSSGLWLNTVVCFGII